MTLECCAMQEWVTEEWTCIEIVRVNVHQSFNFYGCLLAQDTLAQDLPIQYQLDLMADHLCQLCITWQPEIAPIPYGEFLPSWRPSE